MENQNSNQGTLIPITTPSAKPTAMQTDSPLPEAVTILDEIHMDAVQSNRQSIHLALPSIMHSVYILDAVISEIVKRMEFNEETSEEVILAVMEAATNAIKHGNKKDASKLAQFQFIVNPNKLTVVVQDQGAGFNRRSIPDPLHPANRFRGSGRGLFLIEACMDNVTYEASGTIVRMVKYKR